MAADKESFYRDAALRYKASTRIYRVDSVVHVEDEDDIWFWQQMLSKYRGGRRHKFYPATLNERGNRTTGCAQCLKYKDFLSQKFFICIDSDQRFLLDEDISAEKGILQTYTYSWENHCAFDEKLQENFERYTHRGDAFDFRIFLREYSNIVYESFLLMLYQERNGLNDFGRDIFRSLISLTYMHDDELENGKNFLERLKSGLAGATAHAKENCDFDLEREAALYIPKGVTRDNVYLYVRGHCLYNSLVSIGKRLCVGTGVDFEQNILKSTLAFESYDAISRIKADIRILDTLSLEKSL